ncbi:MAG: MBL fold metallo-hydrolase [Thermodesulfobacteriota bacterium]|nr:MBL fold metallo-hydrolase [Thermodesulfobacteriota bacterium]
MKVKFWGTRGSIPVPGNDTTVYGGNTTCLEITLQSGRKIVIDAGTGIRALGEQLLGEGKKVDIHLLITHIHWDHVMGFPFFAPIYSSESKISLDGFPTCLKGLKSTFDNKMGDGFFPIRFDNLKADISYLATLNRGPLEIDSVLVDSIPLQHPQGGFGFRFREGNKTLVFLTDNELVETTEAGTYREEYVRFCKDADVLIHDAQYRPDEIEERRGWGHSDYVAAYNLALNSRVEKLVLFHHDPSRKDPEVMSMKAHCEAIAREGNSDFVIDAAGEGHELIV